MFIEVKHHFRIAWEQHQPHMSVVFAHVEAAHDTFDKVFHFLEVIFPIVLDASRTINEKPKVDFPFTFH